VQLVLNRAGREDITCASNVESCGWYEYLKLRDTQTDAIAGAKLQGCRKCSSSGALGAYGGGVRDGTFFIRRLAVVQKRTGHGAYMGLLALPSKRKHGQLRGVLA
jgi:hypothetical protein